MLFLNVFLHVLPGKNYQKYVRFFGGIILVVIVINPLVNTVKLSDNFDKVWKLESLRGEFEDMEVMRQGMNEMRSEKINAAYKAELKRQMEEIITGFELTPVTTEISFEENEEGVLLITQIVIVASRQKNKINISIKPVGKEENSSDIKKIENEIQEVYHISSANINISIQE